MSNPHCHVEMHSRHFGNFRQETILMAIIWRKILAGRSSEKTLQDLTRNNLKNKRTRSIRMCDLKNLNDLTATKRLTHS